jgi:hypothetical protein
MRRRSLALLAAAGTVAACGGSERPTTRTTTVTPQPPRAPAPQRSPAPAPARRVVKAWSDTLRHGHVAAAARYFALPAIVQIQPNAKPVRITRRPEAVAFNLVLPCGARLVRVDRDGRYVNALFVLTERPGATCDAPGATARTAFLIRGGRIVEWRRAPDEPGDDAAAAGEPAV